MKTIAVFLFILLCPFLPAQQIIFHPGDNIVEYCESNPPVYSVAGPQILNLPEGRVDFYKYKVQTVDEDTKFFHQQSWLTGVLQNQNGVNQMLFDINGDGILDGEYSRIIIPYWILSRSFHTAKGGENNLEAFLDDGIDAFNGDPNPYESGAHQNYVLNFLDMIEPETRNRDLFYAFFLYYYTIQNSPETDLLLLNSIEADYAQRFGTVHPILLLHTAETYMNMGNFDKAGEFVRRLLEARPDFVPGKVYSWQLETNLPEKQKKYNALKAEHPDHWIVRQI